MVGHRLPRKMRLTRARQFDAVFAAKVRAMAGPLVVWGAPNDVGHPRLGLAISRRAGNATTRNRIRRLLRESFRLLQHDLPATGCGYDLVVGVHRHEPMTRPEYEQALLKAARAMERSWSKKLNGPSSTGNT
ncbi:MAG: ribonuclease P protein component [Planctomycetota bacterium]